jgi:hypothetical protein
MSLSHRPAGHLVRHFLSGLFDFGILSETGTASFKRTMLGIATVFLSLGLLLARVYLTRYGRLADEPTADPYQRAVLGDHALLIAIPMWTVAVVTVLIGHALFPDETDYRVLMALPVTRRAIFLSKLAAVVLFAGGFALAAHVALLPLAVLTAFNPWADPTVVARLAAYYGASLPASALAVLLVVAVHGALLALLPRERALAGSGLMRSLLLCALVFAFPALLRLPAAGSALMAGAFWTYLVPPVWFVGLEEWLLGAGRQYFQNLAATAAATLVVAAGVAASSYALVYRRFDRVLLQAGQPSAAAVTRRTRRVPREARRPAFMAIRSFIAITLRRSLLHQGILIVLGAAGVGLAVNSLSGHLVDWWHRNGGPPESLVSAVVWTPFALLLAASVAVRTTLVVPVEQRANWVFRMTEDADARADQLQAAASALRNFGVVLPIAMLLPIQWLVIGAGVVPVVLVEAILGCLVVEIVMRNWQVIPFTSSYMPGKGFLPQTILRASVVFIVFTTVGYALAYLTWEGTSIAMAVDAALLATVVILHRRRRALAAVQPLSFEDLPPTDVQTLGLFSD